MRDLIQHIKEDSNIFKPADAEDIKKRREDLYGPPPKIDPTSEAAYYHWGEFSLTEPANEIDFDRMERLSEDDLAGFDIRDEDMDKVFFADPAYIDRDEDGVAVKHAYAVAVLEEGAIREQEEYALTGPLVSGKRLRGGLGIVLRENEVCRCDSTGSCCLR
jgi:hypothetical protein